MALAVGTVTMVVLIGALYVAAVAIALPVTAYRAVRDRLR